MTATIWKAARRGKAVHPHGAMYAADLVVPGHGETAVERQLSA